MLIDKYEPIILTNYKKNKQTMKKEMLQYFDLNSTALYTADLTESMFFSDDNRGTVFANIGVTDDQLSQDIKESKYIDNSFKVSSNSFYIASTLLISVALKNKDKETAIIAAIYMSCMMYVSMHSQFLQYKGNKAIMDYTISNLDNNTKLKKLGTLFKVLEDNAQVWMDTYAKRFKTCTDNDIVYLINAIQTRIKQKVRKVFNDFYSNWESGKYLNMDTDSYNEEDYRMLDNNSYAVAKLADKVFLNLIQKKPKDTFIKMSISNSDTSFSKLKTLITDIIRDDTNGEVQTIIKYMIEYYIFNSGNLINTIYKGDYIVYMIKAYASNTSSDQMSYIKDTIEKWVKDNSSRYGRSVFGKTAMLSYKKAIYMFFVYSINSESKM